MDKKKLALLMGALVVAIGTALAARSMFAGASAPEAHAAVPVKPQGPSVLVAKESLPVGTIVTADAIGYQLWPKEMVQNAYFLKGQTDMNKLLGTVVRHPITAGEPLTQGALVHPGDRGFLAAALGPGMRAVTIPVSAQTGVGGFVFPGDRVDLLLTQTVNRPGDRPLKTSETIVQNLRVLATDQSPTTKTNDKGKPVVRAFRTVTLEVTPRIAEKIALAQSLGSLSLALRSIADNRTQLDKDIATGKIKVPANSSPEEANRIMTTSIARPVDGPDSFVTSGDVSRFQPRGFESANPTQGPARPTGPTVRIMRGGQVTIVPISASGAVIGAGTTTGSPTGTTTAANGIRSGVRNLVGQEAKGMRNAAATSGAATEATAVIG